MVLLSGTAGGSINNFENDFGKNMQADSGTITHAASAVATVAVTFPTAFSTAPTAVVVCGITNDAQYDIFYALSAGTTGFTCTAVEHGDNVGSNSEDFNYIAML